MQKKVPRKIGFCNIHRQLNWNNFLFEQSNTTIGDDLLRPFQVLRKRAAELGATLATVDVMAVDEMDALVFIDMPDKKNAYFQRAREIGIPIYLMMLESPLVRIENYNVDHRRYFTRVFTYDDSLVDGSFYVKLNYAFSIPLSFEGNCSTHEKLCVMIAGNKNSRHDQELYSERIRAIRWFERNHPDDFDLYGFGWDYHSFKGMKPLGWLNPVKVARKLFAPRYASYRGRVERKLPILKKYRFSICYENIRDVPGYITEKIFDSFFAGCVPIYLGADNVADHIPSGCFIDKRHFETYEKLYAFISQMPIGQYREYQENIVSFMKSEKAQLFDINYFCETLLGKILFS